MEKTAYDQMIAQVRKLPIEKVIQRTLESSEAYRGKITDPTERGFLCPFHDDHKGGHAGIYYSKNGVGKFHCFVCGATYDGIGFVENFENISYYQAVMKIAVTFGIITPEVYQHESGNGFTGTVCKVKTADGKVLEKQNTASTAVLNQAYSVIAEGAKLAGSTDVLMNKDRQYLHERGIKDDEIALYGYFTMPGETFLDEIVRRFAEKGRQAEDLYGVPGFYREKAGNKLRFAAVDGIGIPIRNHDREIVALQVRSRNPLAQPRYKFVSSSFVSRPQYSEDYDRGCGPAATANVVYPYRMTNITKCVCITEGTFKAAQFAEHYDAVGLSVQGVNNTKDVVPELNALTGKLHLDKKPAIYVAYDMDLYENKQVLKALLKLTDQLHDAGYLVYYLNWNEKWKGIDDFLIAKDNHQTDEKIHAVKAERWQKDHANLISRAKPKYKTIPR